MTLTASRRSFAAGLAAATAALAASPAIAEARRSGRYDTIVRGGTVFDGLGGEGREADVGIIGDRIAAIGNLVGARGTLEIDARGQAVAPGFINMLSWATESLIEDGRSQSDIRGLDGSSRGRAGGAEPVNFWPAWSGTISLQ